jgi:hypothetical protein
MHSLIRNDPKTCVLGSSLIRNDPKTYLYYDKFTEILIVVLPQDKDIPVAWKMPAYMGGKGQRWENGCPLGHRRLPAGFLP